MPPSATGSDTKDPLAASVDLSPALKPSSSKGKGKGRGRGGRAQGKPGRGRSTRNKK